MHWGPLLLLFMNLFSVATFAVKVGIVTGPLEDETTEGFSFPLEPVRYRVQWWNSLDIANAVCHLAEQGVQAVVMNGPPRLSPLVSTYTDHMQMPFISVQGSILPDTTHAAADLMQQEKWDSFAFIYQTDMGADQLQKVLRRLDKTPKIEAFWRTNGAEETLEFIKTLPVTRLLLATSQSLADELVSKLTALRKNFYIILLTPVGSVRKKNNPNSSYRLIKFSIADEESTSRLEKSFSTHQGGILDSTLLNHETSKVLETLFSQISTKSVFQQKFDCFNFSTGIEKFALNQVVVKQSLSGEIKFDNEERRVGYKLNIYEELPFDLQKIGTWGDVSGLQLLRSGVQMSPSFAAFQNAGTPLRVTSVLVTPFLFMGPSGSLEGYVVDFLEEMMAVIQLPYRIQVVKDGGYGRNISGGWTGMIGELIRNEADIAMAPLTKTRDREKVVDFSKVFMTVGLNLLIKKPDNIQHESSSFGPFSFLAVWSVELWMVVVVAVIIFGAACFLISYFIAAPDRVRALESKGTDSLSPCGSFWFTLASLLRRDTGIYPRTFTHRVWAILWWTFCFFLVIGYISSLSAYLTDTRKSITTTYSRKTSHDVVQDLLEKGTPDIGAVRSGSTPSFFLNSDIGFYNELGRYLERNPQQLMTGYDEGVKKVRQSGGSYAFLMESSGSQFHANSEPCDTVVSSGYLTTKSHAVALQKNSPYKEMVDHGVLTLMETGFLRKLYEKWWHNYSSFCEDPNMDILPRVYSRSLTLHEVSGIFYILILFAIASVVAAFVEKYTSARQITFD